jgi:hypothetical protein
VARDLVEVELIGNWTLVGDELEQLSGRRSATKLGLALLLRFYAVHGRFPSGRSEIPDQAVAYVARLVDVPASDLGFYAWDGRTIKAHRADVRRYFGFRECSVADADKAAEWLAANVCEKERQAGRVRVELLAHLKREQVEPPARDRIRRIIGAAMRQAEQALATRIASRVPAEAVGRMRALIARAADAGEEEDAGPWDDSSLFDATEVTGVDAFAAIRDEPGNVSVKTIGQEAFKLGAIRAVGLPDDLFADVAPKVLAGWRARVAAEAPSHLRSHPHEIVVTLLAAYLYCRQREITDALVDLLIATVHRINARADTKVTKDFVAECPPRPGPLPCGVGLRGAGDRGVAGARPGGAGAAGRSSSWRGPVPEHCLAQRFGFGVRGDEVGGLRDFPFGVGDDDVCLVLDRRAEFGVVAGHVGAGFEQPEQRVGHGWLVGAVTADEAAHHGEVFGESPPGHDDRRAAGVAGNVVSQRPPGERAEDHRQVIDGLDGGVGVVDRRGQCFACRVDQLPDPERGVLLQGPLEPDPDSGLQDPREQLPVRCRVAGGSGPDPRERGPGDHVLADPGP